MIDGCPVSRQLAAVSWQALQTAYCKLQTYIPSAFRRPRRASYPFFANFSFFACFASRASCFLPAAFIRLLLTI